MKLSEFKEYLDRSADHQLRFVLPDGGLIEAHAHITEVGRVQKRFIDCGGTIRSAAYCCLQAWVADDIDHRLVPGSLSSIIEKAGAVLEGEDLDVEIEYEDGLLSQFPVAAAEVRGDALHFFLTTKHTDCLAKELCLPGGSNEGSCCTPGSGCC